MYLEELKKLSQTDFAKFEGNEQNVKYNIVLRFLNYFGYDKLDLEHAAQGSRIDINIGNKIIVETKSLDKNLNNYVSQVQQYCNTERPDLAILTNGRVFRFYSPFMRVSTFTDTLIYEFILTDFSNEEVIERINKIIGYENYKNKTYITFIEERENELRQVHNFLADHDQRKLADIQAIQTDIEQLKSEITKLESEIKLKQQELEQIKSKKIPEKEELFKKHFVPSVTTTIYAPPAIELKKSITISQANIDIPEYAKSRARELERGGDTLTNRMLNYIRTRKTVTWEELKNACVKEFGYKETSGSIGGSLSTLVHLNKIRIDGRGDDKKISINE